MREMHVGLFVSGECYIWNRIKCSFISLSFVGVTNLTHIFIPSFSTYVEGHLLRGLVSYSSRVGNH